MCFFFKQKTAYEMRISDWSSDVCSSDLWVIEDRFAGPRPDFAALGVQLTQDVAPWEEAKLRLLNGAHSGIAYLGGLAGIDYVHEVVATEAGRRFVEALWDEAGANLSPPPRLDFVADRTRVRQGTRGAVRVNLGG